MADKSVWPDINAIVFDTDQLFSTLNPKIDFLWGIHFPWPLKGRGQSLCIDSSSVEMPIAWAAICQLHYLIVYLITILYRYCYSKRSFWVRRAGFLAFELGTLQSIVQISFKLVSPFFSEPLSWIGGSCLIDFCGFWS